MGSPVDDALDRLREYGYIAAGVVTRRREEVRGAEATVRQRLAEQDTEIQRLREERDAYRIEGDHGHDDYEDAEDVIRQIAEARPNRAFDPWARGLCQEFLDRPRRSRATIATIRERAEAAEAEVQRLTGIVRDIRDSSTSSWTSPEQTLRIVAVALDALLADSPPTEGEQG